MAQGAQMSSNDDQSLAERVRQIRKDRNWTQQDMADAAGMSLRAYQSFELGQSKPQAANLRGLLTAAGLDADDAETAEDSRSEFPRDTRVFLDMLGAYLNTMSDDQRLEVIHDLTRQIFEANRST